ncbi:CD209 antigen-like protein E isoform X2 [Epinephelus fuscoguttatus]|uniref:CD209 antigen-like protein E isoform X2 n=1 Tax=Epinephelus fuscoguttatus TaxID=293821 RepID=UPI0020D0D1CE|nr:CD209 antigen-like protein E isoform X2 [Epinephelus fuscoguttatus]
MEEVYENAEYEEGVEFKGTPKKQTGSEVSKRFPGAVVLFLGLLSVLLLAGLIGVCVHCHVSAYGSAPDLSMIKANLTESLNARITEMIEELKKSVPKEKTCPAGWRMFSGACYLLSSGKGSWDEGRKDCRGRGADLVAIDSSAEQEFLNKFTQTYAWIGLTDRVKEGTWKWIDGTPLTLSNWEVNQPDNGGGNPRFGEEDCVHIRPDSEWNDRSCETSMRWICEKTAPHC